MNKRLNDALARCAEHPLDIEGQNKALEVMEEMGFKIATGGRVGPILGRLFLGEAVHQRIMPKAEYDRLVSKAQFAAKPTTVNVKGPYFTKEEVRAAMAEAADKRKGQPK